MSVWAYTRSTPTHVWPALEKAPKAMASAAASTSASASTSRASLPPHSSTTGVRVAAQDAITRLPTAEEPVNEMMSAPESHSAAPVAPAPVTSCRTGGPGTASAKLSTSQAPTEVDHSEGLNTTALPAANA